MASTDAVAVAERAVDWQRVRAAATVIVAMGLIVVGMVLQFTRSASSRVIERARVDADSELIFDRTRIRVVGVLRRDLPRDRFVNACNADTSGVTLIGDKLADDALVVEAAHRRVCLAPGHARVVRNLELVVNEVAPERRGGGVHEIEIRSADNPRGRMLDNGASIAVALGLGIISGAMAQWIPRG